MALLSDVDIYRVASRHQHYIRSLLTYNRDQYLARVYNKYVDTIFEDSASIEDMISDQDLVEYLIYLELVDTVSNPKSNKIGEVMGMPVYKCDAAMYLHGSESLAYTLPFFPYSNGTGIIVVESPLLKLPNSIIDYVILHEIGHSLTKQYHETRPASTKIGWKRRHADELAADLYAADHIGYDNAINGRRLLSTMHKSSPYYGLEDDILMEKERLLSEGKSVSRKLDVSTKIWKSK